MNKTDRIQYIKYDKKGLMKFERNYYYYSIGNLKSVETHRANGEGQIWSAPCPCEGQCGIVLYQTLKSTVN
jgi:hypothetical protein